MISDNILLSCTDNKVKRLSDFWLFGYFCDACQGVIQDQRYHAGWKDPMLLPRADPFLFWGLRWPPFLFLCGNSKHPQGWGCGHPYMRSAEHASLGIIGPFPLQGSGCLLPSNPPLTASSLVYPGIPVVLPAPHSLLSSGSALSRPCSFLLRPYI